MKCTCFYRRAFWIRDDRDMAVTVVARNGYVQRSCVTVMYLMCDRRGVSVTGVTLHVTVVTCNVHNFWKQAKRYKNFNSSNTVVMIAETQYDNSIK